MSFEPYTKTVFLGIQHIWLLKYMSFESYTKTNTTIQAVEIYVI